MKIDSTLPKLFTMLLVSLLLMSVSFAVFAVNCTKKPDHPDCVDPPPDSGGNDTADPDWKIWAIRGDHVSDDAFEAAIDCFAFNPDLKGPGIAYLGFYDHFGYTTCAETTTLVGSGTGTTIDLRRIDVKTDSDGNFTTIQLSGRNPENGVIYESAAVNFADTGQPGETSEVPFTLHVHQDFSMFGCGTDRKKGNTVCDEPAGTIILGDLIYCPLGDDIGDC